MAPKPEKIRVRTHPKKHDTHSLHERKCEVRTPFLMGPYPVSLSCKRALHVYLTTNNLTAGKTEKHIPHVHNKKFTTLSVH